MEMKWYTIYTQPNSEKKVTATLDRKNIINFCPANLLSVKEQINKNNENFNGYVFVKVTESQIPQIKQIKGFKHVLYFMNQPATVNEYEINLMKRFLNDHNNIRLEKKEVGFNGISNNTASTENGAKLIDMNNNKVKAALPSLGYMMVANTAASAVTTKVIGNPILNTLYRIAR